MTGVTAESLGAVQNRLGFLSADKKRIVPDRVLGATGLNRSQLAKALEVPRPALYRETIPIPAQLKMRIIHLCIATDFVFELTKDVEETQKWLMSPSAFFFGDSPFQIILRGDGRTIIEWLAPRVGQGSAAAF